MARAEHTVSLVALPSSFCRPELSTGRSPREHDLHPDPRYILNPARYTLHLDPPLPYVAVIALRYDLATEFPEALDHALDRAKNTKVLLNPRGGGRGATAAASSLTTAACGGGGAVVRGGEGEACGVPPKAAAIRQVVATAADGRASAGKAM